MLTKHVVLRCYQRGLEEKLKVRRATAICDVTSGAFWDVLLHFET